MYLLHKTMHDQLYYDSGNGQYITLKQYNKLLNFKRKMKGILAYYNLNVYMYLNIIKISIHFCEKRIEKNCRITFVMISWIYC